MAVVSVSGSRLVLFLDELVKSAMLAMGVARDNGTEMVSKVMRFWREMSGSALCFI